VQSWGRGYQDIFDPYAGKKANLKKGRGKDTALPHEGRFVVSRGNDISPPCPPTYEVRVDLMTKPQGEKELARKKVLAGGVS